MGPLIDEIKLQNDRKKKSGKFEKKIENILRSN